MAPNSASSPTAAACPLPPFLGAPPLPLLPQACFSRNSPPQTFDGIARTSCRYWLLPRTRSCLGVADVVGLEWSATPYAPPSPPSNAAARSATRQHRPLRVSRAVVVGAVGLERGPTSLVLPPPPSNTAVRAPHLCLCLEQGRARKSAAPFSSTEVARALRRRYLSRTRLRARCHFPRPQMRPRALVTGAVDLERGPTPSAPLPLPPKANLVTWIQPAGT